MVIIAPPLQPPRRRLRTRRRKAIAPPVAPLTLVSAVWDVGEALMMLVFNRPVAVGAYDSTQIVLADHVNENQFDGSGGALVIDPVTVQISPVYVEPATPGPAVLLSATGATGIVAADDGSPWAGVTDLELPFP